MLNCWTELQATVFLTFGQLLIVLPRMTLLTVHMEELSNAL